MNKEYKYFEEFYSMNSYNLERQEFLKELEFNPNLKKEYKSFLRIKELFVNNNFELQTPDNYKENLFSKLDLKEKKRVNQLMFLFPIIITSLIVFTFLVFTNKISNHQSDISSKANNHRVYEKQDITIYPPLVTSKLVSEKKGYISSTIMNKNSKTKLDDVNQPISMKSDKVGLAVNKVSTIAFNKNIINKQTGWNTQNLHKVEILKSDLHSSIPLRLKVRRNFDYDLTKQVTSPSSISDFSNISFSLNYNLDKYLSIGAGISQENFNLEYLVEENGESYIFYQRPNFTTYEILTIYRNILNNDLHYNLGMSLGYNNVGFVPRVSIGVEYSLFENFGIDVNGSFNSLIYQKSGTTYTSNKFSLQFGAIYSWN